MVMSTITVRAFRSIAALLLAVALSRQLVLLHRLAGASPVVDVDHRHLHVATNRDEFNYWEGLIDAAAAANHTCDGTSTKPSSLRATLGAPASVAVSLATHHPHYREADSEQLKFVPIHLTFRAYTKQAMEQTTGGDVFIVDVQADWPEHEPLAGMRAVVKSAAFARDNFDGTYTATLLMPRLPKEGKVDISLRHYYTCHEGMRLPLQFGKDYDAYSARLQFGPLPWTEASDAVRSFLAGLPFNETVGAAFVANPHQPACSESDRKDDVLHGVWRDLLLPKALPGSNTNATPPSVNAPRLSEHARWSPFHCTMAMPRSSSGKHLRVGDSTMPGRAMSGVGIPYQPWNVPRDYDKHQRLFTDFLRGPLFHRNETYGSNDTLLFGGGLHHVQNGHFNIGATVDLVVRSLCQLALAYPGMRLILKGPNPIAQHKYNVVDQTSLVARRINWELSQRLQSMANRLAAVCGSIPFDDVPSFVALADPEGNVLPKEDAAPHLRQRYNYSWERDSSDDQKELAKWIGGLSADERTRRYGDRAVQWVDLEEFLLPRSELYRDKIHDGLKFSHGEHSNLLTQIEGDLERYLSSQMEMQRTKKKG